MSDYDKQQWQAEQAARDAALEKQREKERKARERSARNAARKLERLRRTLEEKGEISEFEAEFSESVSERLDKFGSAFGNPELGRPGDALSSAQKRVVAGMNRKVKELRRKPKVEGEEPEDDFEEEISRPRYDRAAKPRSSFKSKTQKWTPRVRQLDDEFEEEAPEPVVEAEPEPERPSVGKPFLRVLKDVPEKPERTPEPVSEPKPRASFLRVVSSND